MRLIAPFGFYGWGNIGDESTLQGFARLLRLSRLPASAWVGAQDLRQCRRAAPSFRYFPAAARRSVRRRWAWKAADAMVVPGGTPIMDSHGRWPLEELASLVRRAVAAGLPIGFIGVGTEPLAREESRGLLAEVLAPNVTVWTVRSERDRERLVAGGVARDRVTAAGDMAWLLDGASPEVGQRYLAGLGVDLRRPIVGVNVNIEPWTRGEHPGIVAELAGFLDATVDRHGVTLLFLANEVRDSEGMEARISRELVAAMRRRERAVVPPNTYWRPQDMMSLIGCCAFTVSTRYHFCLFSALQGVPFLAVERSPKVSDLCEDLGWAGRVTVSEAGRETLASRFADLVGGRATLAARLGEGRVRLRARAERNVSALAVLNGFSMEAM